ncbi:MAG: ATP-binding protein [Bacteroidales bacterium]|nr:ATP-binding protein [Bacteroidales bacterium]
MARISKHIADLISGGESQTLDFKFEISDAKKIAKTLVAFANTNGGTLLVGVKDNGAIAGVRTDEEIFMVDSAAKMFSNPPVHYEVEPWYIDGKQILEIIILQGDKKPYFAQEKNGRWRSYVRVFDQNFLANNVLVRYWKEKEIRNVELKYTREIEFLLEFLNDYPRITIDEFCKRAEISKKSAENILVDLLILKIIEMKINDNVFYYKLSNNEQ